MSESARPSSQDSEGRDTFQLKGRRFIGYSLFLSATFLLFRLAGFHEYTSVLSGTEALGSLQRFLGFAYIILYFLFAGVVPILLIAFFILNAASFIKRRLDVSEPECE